VALTSVVLFAFGAFAIDISSLWAERRQVQNGADAASLAVAQSCAAGDCNSGSGYELLAQQYADDNANDNASNVPEVCGPASSGLPTCTDPPTTTPPGDGWVMVRTQTGNDDGAGVVPPILAKFLVPGYDGSTVKTYAIANWGAPQGVDGGLALTFSACEWLEAVGVDSIDDQATAAYPAPPPYPNTTDASIPAKYSPAGWPVDASGDSMERTIYLHDTSAAGTCPAGPAGSDLPGGFGWLDNTDDTCYATTNADDQLTVDPGNNVTNPCKDALDASLGTVIYLPVFDSTNDLNGNNGAYNIAGYAAFYMTGYYLGSVKEPSAVTGDYPCSGQARCISGFFTEALSANDGNTGVVGDGPSFGASIVGLYQ
jgi:hypothetical protein